MATAWLGVGAPACVLRLHWQPALHSHCTCTVHSLHLHCTALHSLGTNTELRRTGSDSHLALPLGDPEVGPAAGNPARRGLRDRAAGTSGMGAGDSSPRRPRGASRSALKSLRRQARGNSRGSGSPVGILRETNLWHTQGRQRAIHEHFPVSDDITIEGPKVIDPV